MEQLEISWHMVGLICMAQRLTADLLYDTPGHYPTLTGRRTTPLLFVSASVCATYVQTAASTGPQ